MGRSPWQAKSRQAMEYRPAGTENNECVQKVHRVDLKQRHSLETWDQVHPGGKVGQEGVYPY